MKQAKATHAPHRNHDGDGLGELPVNGRKAVAVDPEIKISNLKRLRRIEGQIRGLQKMVEEDRYCADIVVQIASVQEALRSVGRELMKNHLHHCAAQAIRRGNEDEASAMYEELLELIYKHLR
jgi:CsoR family transcriptional regulator, copper-sensing transcriptional repressor